MPSPQRLLPVNDVLYTVDTDVAGTRARLVVDTGAEICWDMLGCLKMVMCMQKVISPNLFVIENLTFYTNFHIDVGKIGNGKDMFF